MTDGSSESDTATSGAAAADSSAADSAADTPASEGMAADEADSTSDSTTDSASDPTADQGADGSYSGILGAFPYAYRSSESRLFRSYVAVGGLLTAGIVLLFALAIVDLLGQTAAAPGGTFTFSRAFFLVLMLLVIGPLVAPVLLVARRHRREGSTGTYDRALAATGYGFLASLYVMLVLSVPAEQQAPPGGLFGPVVAAMYDLPQVAGVVPPLVAVAVLILVHRRMS